MRQVLNRLAGAGINRLRGTTVMPEFLVQHWKEILGVVTALVAGGLVFKLISVRVTSSPNRVDQRGARSRGDIVGRDNNRNRRG